MPTPTLQEIVDHFKRCTRRRRRLEEQFYVQAGHLEEAIARSLGLRSYRGVKHPHQQRIPPVVLKRVEKRLLLAIGQIRSVRTFAELHAIVERECKPVQGAGPLLVYDVAHRLGLYLKCAPVEVYLHAGTAKGARAIGFRGTTIARADLPAPLRSLSPAELEDLFCNYSAALAGGELPPCFDEIEGGRNC